MAATRIKQFKFKEGHRLGKKYEIVKRLGGGWEGDVFIIRELLTGIERAAKFFLPQRNKNNSSVKFYAKKLHKLRHCTVLIQYLTQEIIRYQGEDVTYLVSEYVEGEPLSEFLNRQKGKKLQPFQATHLLYALARGMETVHASREYHGDLHTDNVIVSRYGLGFDLKLIDMFHWGKADKENIQRDVCDLIRIYYDALGGQKYYHSQPPAVKDIICGLKQNLILKKYRNAGQLRAYLERITWE